MAVGMLLVICTCGGLGAVARFVVDTAIKRTWRTVFPISTLVINITAAILFALTIFSCNRATGYVPGASASIPAYTIATTGFLGGFSTFSTAMNETFTLLTRGREDSKHYPKYYRLAAYYVLASFIIPVACIAVVLSCAI